MWDYSEKVMEHYRNPKNVGEIENPTVVGEAGSLVCGDMLKLYLKINDKNVVEDAKFQTFGCGSAVASSSILTEMIIGKTLDEVKKITNKDIANELGGLPPQKMHCSVMGQEALEDALKKLSGEKKDNQQNDNNDKIVCQCFNISENLLRKEIRENNLKTVEDVTNYVKAGGACGHCKSSIAAILNEELASSEKQQEIAKLSPTQKILKINNVIETSIVPMLQKDGGDIEFVDYDTENNIVTVKLKGRCSACKNALLTLKNLVETTLREHVDKNIQVKQA